MPYPRYTHAYTPSKFEPDIEALDLPKPIVCMVETNPVQLRLGMLVGRVVSANVLLDGMPLIYTSDESGKEIELIAGNGLDCGWTTDSDAFDIVFGLLPEYDILHTSTDEDEL